MSVRLTGVREKWMCVCVRACSWCALTFQSMVEKKECRLISSTPSGPAPADTDHCGSVELACFASFHSFWEDHTLTHSHTALARGWGWGWVVGVSRHVMLRGCQNATSLSKRERCNTRGSAWHPPTLATTTTTGLSSQQPVRCKHLPSLLAGFRLNSILSKLWASRLRNWGIPSFALKQPEENKWLIGDYRRKLISTKLSAQRRKKKKKDSL